MKKNFIRTIVILLVSFSISSCSELLDCIASARPELKSKNLRTATVGYSYYDFINSEVTNDPNDNDYDYFFSIDNQLPPGINYHIEGRKVILDGVATQAGTYTFKVTLTVNFPNYYNPNQGFFEDGNRICFGDDTTSKNYTIVVQ